MQNPFTALVATIKRPLQESAVMSRAIMPPYRQPGYKAPEQMTAVDYLTPEASWPLVWILDISGYDAVSGRSSGQTSFGLSSPPQGGAAVRLQCQVPIHEGRLFDKEGTYVVVAIPAEDEEQIRAILSLVGR